MLIDDYDDKDQLNKNVKPLGRLNLTQCSDALEVSTRIVRDRLNELNVMIHGSGKATYVYAVELYAKMDLPMVMTLVEEFPEDWRMTYSAVSKSEEVYHYAVRLAEKELELTPILTSSIAKSKEELDYLKELYDE